MGDKKEVHDYEEILYLPHPVSEKRMRMPMHKRAAQFSPFAALSGYKEAIAESNRYTEQRVELSEDMLTVLNERMQILSRHLEEKPVIEVTYFIPDARKSGGKFVTIEGNLIRIDHRKRVLIMESGEKIPVDDISNIESRLFYQYPEVTQ